MPTRALTVELPEEPLALLGSDEKATINAREALVMELLRDSAVSQGQAAELLGITRWDMLDLMAHYRVPSGPESVEELQQDLESVLRAQFDR